MNLHHNRLLTFQSLTLKKWRLLKDGMPFWYLLDFQFPHKTGQMPQNSMNVSCKSDLQIAWISITGREDQQLCRREKWAEVVSLSPKINSPPPTPKLHSIMFISWINVLPETIFYHST